MTTRDELVAILDAVDFNHDSGSDDFASNGEYADAILANWTPQTVTKPDEDLGDTVIPSRAEVLETWAKNLSLYDEMGDPDPAWVAGIESARRAALDEAARLRENEVKS